MARRFIDNALAKKDGKLVALALDCRDSFEGVFSTAGVKYLPSLYIADLGRGCVLIWRGWFQLAGSCLDYFFFAGFPQELFREDRARGWSRDRRACG